MLALSAIAAGLAVEGARAQAPDNNKLMQLSLAQLGSLEVASVSKVPEEIRLTPAAVFVLTQEDIRRSGATSIPEALRLVPGVEVARIDSDKWAIGVRGFGSRLSRSLLVLIDGRSVYTPLFAGVYWEVQDTLLEDIERIEVIRGPGGTVWGSNAVNGVINIITKSASATHGVLASVGGGNLDQGFANFRYGSGNGGDFSYRVYGKAFTRGPQYHPDNHNFDDWRMGQGGFRTDWNLRDHDTLTIQGDLYTRGHGKQPGGEQLHSSFDQHHRAEHRRGGGQRDGALAARIAFGRWLSSAGLLRSHGSRGYQFLRGPQHRRCGFHLPPPVGPAEIDRRVGGAIQRQRRLPGRADGGVLAQLLPGNKLQRVRSR